MNHPSRKDQPVHPDGRHVVGIDVGKQSHAAAGLTAAGREFGRVISFENNRAGLDRLEQLMLKPLGGPDKILIGMESTGRAIVRQLGLSPAALAGRHDDLSSLVRTASRGQVDQAAVQDLLNRAAQSIGIARAERVIVDQLRSVISLIETIESQIAALDDELETRVAKLRSPLPSLGLRAPIVATIHAESDPIADFRRPWQYAAYTGLDPSTIQSGNYKAAESHISKRGSPYLRRAIFLAAASLYRHNKPLLRLYQRSRKAGHHHTDALVIVAHKLARIVWRLLTDNRPFRVNAPNLRRNAPAVVAKT